MEPEQDTEITLGTAKLLGLFFGLVIVCAVFFALGYRCRRHRLQYRSNADFIQRNQARRFGVSSTRSADDFLQSGRAKRRQPTTHSGLF